MRSLKVRLTAVAIVTLSLSALNVQAKTDNDSIQCGLTDLHIEKNNYEVKRSGTIIGDNYCEYRFYAKKGQKVSVDITGSPDLYPMLYSENSKDLKIYTVSLGKNGEQTIRVLQSSNTASDGKPKLFTITVKIK